jgi:hypothetical protein
MASILLAVFVAASGFTAQASMIPFCAGVSMPASANCSVSQELSRPSHSCCGDMGADCDCSLQNRSNGVFQEISVNDNSRFESSSLELQTSKSNVSSETFKLLPKTKEASPQKTPLYDLYSDYRI